MNDINIYDVNRLIEAAKPNERIEALVRIDENLVKLTYTTRFNPTILKLNFPKFIMPKSKTFLQKIISLVTFNKY